MKTDWIDKKLANLGFDQKFENDSLVSYTRKRYEFDMKLGKRVSDYQDVVQIGKIFDGNAKISVGFKAFMLGETCPWGSLSCSILLDSREVRLFMLKMRKMELIWKAKDWFNNVKRRLSKNE